MGVIICFFPCRDPREASEMCADEDLSKCETASFSVKYNIQWDGVLSMSSPTVRTEKYHMPMKLKTKLQTGVYHFVGLLKSTSVAKLNFLVFEDWFIVLHVKRRSSRHNRLWSCWQVRFHLGSSLVFGISCLLLHVNLSFSRSDGLRCWSVSPHLCLLPATNLLQLHIYWH